MSVLKAIDLKVVALIVIGVIGSALIWFVPGMVAPAYAADVPADAGFSVSQGIMALWAWVPASAQPWALALMGLSWAGSWLVDSFVEDKSIAKWSPWLRVPFDVVTGRFNKSKRF